MFNIAKVMEPYKLAMFFIYLAWPLALLPVFFEGLQHYAEYKLGMFQAESLEDFGQQAHNILHIFRRV